MLSNVKDLLGWVARAIPLSAFVYIDPTNLASALSLWAGWRLGCFLQSAGGAHFSSLTRAMNLQLLPWSVYRRSVALAMSCDVRGWERGNILDHQALAG